MLLPFLTSTQETTVNVATPVYYVKWFKKKLLFLIFYSFNDSDS